MPDSLTIIRPSIGDQVNTVINNLADKLKVPVTHLYSVLVRQAYTEGVIDIATAVIVLGILIAALVVIYKAYRQAVTERDGYTKGRFVASMLGGIVALAAFIAFMVCLRDGIREVVNPEYAALTLIVAALKGR